MNTMNNGVCKSKVTQLQQLKNSINFYEKPFLTIDEGVAYFGIGRNNLIDFLYDHQDFILLDKTKKLIKKDKLEKHFNNISTI